MVWFFICSLFFSYIQDILEMSVGNVHGWVPLPEAFLPETPTQIKTTYCCPHCYTSPILGLGKPSTVLSTVTFLFLHLDINILWILFHIFSHISCLLKVKGMVSWRKLWLPYMFMWIAKLKIQLATSVLCFLPRNDNLRVGNPKSKHPGRKTTKYSVCMIDFPISAL